MQYCTPDWFDRQPGVQAALHKILKFLIIHGNTALACHDMAARKIVGLEQLEQGWNRSPARGHPGENRMDMMMRP
jgi:hypothetical protein